MMVEAIYEDLNAFLGTFPNFHIKNYNFLFLKEAFH